MVILRVLDEASKNSERLSAATILERMNVSALRWWFQRMDDRGLQIVEEVLDELSAIGITANEGGWYLPRTQQSNPREVRADEGLGADGPTGDGPPGDGPPGGGPRDSDGGQGGIGEVLAHPYLFSIDKPAFNAAIDRALTEY